MAGVAPVLLDEVEQQAAQAGVGAVAGTDVRTWSSPPSASAASARLRDRCTASSQMAYSSSGLSAAAEVKSQSGSASQSADRHGSPGGSPLSLTVNMKSSARARCLSRPPNVRSDDGDPVIEPGGVEAAGLPPERGPQSLERTEQVVELAAGERRLPRRRVEARHDGNVT